MFIATTSIAGVVGAAHVSGQVKAAPATLSGIVAGSYFTPPEGQIASKTTASYYGAAKVCVDLNNDGLCGPDEMSSMTNAKGAFVFDSAIVGPITAEISTVSTNEGHLMKRRVVFRAAREQVAADIGAGRSIVITPVSTELVRMMEVDSLDFATTQRNLAQRLNVPADQVLRDPHAVTPRTALTSPVDRIRHPDCAIQPRRDNGALGTKFVNVSPRLCRRPS